MAKDASSLSKQYSRRLVAEVLLHQAPLSRAALARATGLSKQTMSLVIADLEAEGWVRSVGVSKGAIGRTAVSYDLARDAALVDRRRPRRHQGLARHRRSRRQDDRRNHRADRPARRRACPAPGPRAGAAGSPRAKASTSRARAASSSGMPGVVDPETGAVALVPNIRGPVVDQRAEAAGRPVRPAGRRSRTTSISRCSAKPGRAARKARENAAFLAIGTGVGLGLIVNGRHRARRAGRRRRDRLPADRRRPRLAGGARPSARSSSKSAPPASCAAIARCGAAPSRRCATCSTVSRPATRGAARRSTRPRARSRSP